jgi:hypothetical protein
MATSGGARLPLIWVTLVSVAQALPHRNEYLSSFDKPDHYQLPLPSSYLTADDLPEEFTWANADGQGLSLVTKNLNQHIPQVRSATIGLRSLEWGVVLMNLNGGTLEPVHRWSLCT